MIQKLKKLKIKKIINPNKAEIFEGSVVFSGGGR